MKTYCKCDGVIILLCGKSLGWIIFTISCWLSFPPKACFHSHEFQGDYAKCYSGVNGARVLSCSGCVCGKCDLCWEVRRPECVSHHATVQRAYPHCWGNTPWWYLTHTHNYIESCVLRGECFHIFVSRFFFCCICPWVPILSIFPCFCHVVAIKEF